jgi:hypothetical protein
MRSKVQRAWQQWTEFLRKARYAVGLLCLFGVVALWTGSNFVMSVRFSPSFHWDAIRAAGPGFLLDNTGQQ